MFAYSGNTISTLPPTTLVATPLPNSNALRAPYDNVPPSVSSSQLDNNASGNRNYLPKENASTFVITNSPAENFSTGNPKSNSSPYTANAQTSFLTQLASGDISPEVRGLFAQYEKLVSYANVKYKPSNAGKPSEPTSMFKTLLQIEQVSGSYNLPDEPTTTLPSEIQSTKYIPVAQAREDILPTKPEAAITTSLYEIPDRLNQDGIKIYNSATKRADSVIPANIETA